MLNVDIFFDAVAVQGACELAEDLSQQARALAQRSKGLLQAMTLNTSDLNTPLNWLGRPRLQAGRIDLKLHGILPIVSAARVRALTDGIAARSTPERLEAVREKGLVDSGLIDNLLAAHKILLGAILRQQLRDLNSGLALTNSVAPNEMTAHDRQELTWALRRVDDAHDLLGTPE